MPIGINGLILAGGRSRRFGADKAFAMLHGRPLIEHAIERIAPQVDRLFISSNAPAEHFAAYGIEVITDKFADFMGPLAGVHAALSRHTDAPLLAVAVDLPFLPDDLAAQLLRMPLTDRCRYVALPGPMGHALILLCPPALATAIEDYLGSGKHSVQGLLATYGEAITLDPDSTRLLGININRPEDLGNASRR